MTAAEEPPVDVGVGDDEEEWTEWLQKVQG